MRCCRRRGEEIDVELWGGLRGLEQKKRRRCRGGQEVCSLSASRMGRKRVTREKARRGGKGRRKKSWRDRECVRGLSEGFINESRCLALWTCRVADGDGGDGALDSPDGYHSLSSSYLSTAFPSARRVRGERGRNELGYKEKETDNIHRAQRRRRTRRWTFNQVISGLI